jgi:hypothetical protein
VLIRLAIIGSDSSRTQPSKGTFDLFGNSCDHELLLLQDACRILAHEVPEFSIGKTLAGVVVEQIEDDGLENVGIAFVLRPLYSQVAEGSSVECFRLVVINT